ncbi:hypothetical protein ABMA28_009373 [Loxostege sticticalis]|uniref:CCHC-type domain-containing protein n=1 Tax=Loxostege sticticalis TaxID=481309 RepID=A0ABD0SD39_LOXSC
MSEKSMATIEKLKGREDYASWKFAVQAYLEHEELWDCVAPIEGGSVDSKKDVKARSKLILLVDPMNDIHIQEAKSAKEVWNNLGKAFDDSGLTRRVGLLRELITTSLENCTSIEDYVNKIMTSAHKLRNIGFEVKDEWLGTLLLTGLPEEYKPMLMALESSGVAITADLVKTKLLQEVKSSETGVFFTNRKKLQPIKQGGTSKGPRCYSCNKYGHISRNCKVKANSNKKSDAKCDANPISIPADPHVTLEKSSEPETDKAVPFREAVGSLMYVAVVTRPDVMYALCTASRFLNSFNQTHWNAVKRVFKYLKETKRFGLCYRSNENSTIEGFSDADYANDPVTRRSTTGYVFMRNGGAVTWCSQRQPTVALSTTEAEFIAACCATKEALWIRQLMCNT